MGQWLSQTRRFNKFYTNGGAIIVPPSDYGIIDPMYKVQGGIIPHLYGINGSTFPSPASADFKVQKSLPYGTPIKTIHYEYPGMYELAFNLYHIGEYQTELLGTENAQGVDYALPTIDLYAISIAYVNLLFTTWASAEQYLPSDFHSIPIDKDIRNIVASNPLFTLTSSDVNIGRGDITSIFSGATLRIHAQQGIYLFSEITSDIMDKLKAKPRITFQTYTGTTEAGQLGRLNCFWEDLSGARGETTGTSGYNRLNAFYYSDSFPESSLFSGQLPPSSISPLLTDPRDTSDFSSFMTEYSRLYPLYTQNRVAIDSFLYSYSNEYASIPAALSNYSCLKLKTLLQGLFTPVIPKLNLFYPGGTNRNGFSISSAIQNPSTGVYYTYITIPKIKGVTII